MAEPGRIRETYHAAIQLDPVDLTRDEQLAGVVRRPTGWFHGAIDDNYHHLGPPAALLDEVTAVQESLAADGRSDAAALEAAWDATDFTPRYLEYLWTDADAGEAPSVLRDSLRDGQNVVLVCFEAKEKRCPRHLLVDLLANRVTV